ncbi:hypothetical protein KK107_04380 [Clavibacter michiganensis]|nr:hypothetical protein [Clavibacter michiganensis]
MEVPLGLSRKNKKELAKLRTHAAAVLKEQREVLDRANVVVAEAAHTARKLSDQHVVPAVKRGVDDHIRPGYEAGAERARAAADSAYKGFTHTVLPAVAGAAGSAVAATEGIRNSKQVKDAVKKAGKVSSKAQEFGKHYVDNGRSYVGRYVPQVAPAKKGLGFGGVALIALGVVVVGGVGYALYQTFRADDDLWIADDEPEAVATTAQDQPAS